MKRNTKDIKWCSQLSSNDTLFDDIWFNGVKTGEAENAEVVEYCAPAKTSHMGFYPDNLKN